MLKAAAQSGRMQWRNSPGSFVLMLLASCSCCRLVSVFQVLESLERHPGSIPSNFWNRLFQLLEAFEPLTLAFDSVLLPCGTTGVLDSLPRFVGGLQSPEDDCLNLRSTSRRRC